MRWPASLVALVLACACTPPSAVPADVSRTADARVGAAAGPRGSAVQAARASRYASLAGVIVGPIAAASEHRQAPEEPDLGTHDAVFLRRAVIDVGDVAGGTRTLSVEITWEDARGDQVRERREGVVRLVKGQHELEWLGPAQELSP